MGQQTGYLKTVFKNDTTVLPFNVDTDTISKTIPEIKAKYPDNKDMEIKLYIKALDHVQPLLRTDDDGSLFTFNFGLDFLVRNSTEEWEDPNKELQLNVTAHLRLQYMISDNKLTILAFRTVIDAVDKKFDDLNVDVAVLKTSLDGLLNDILNSYKPSLKGIDVFGYITRYFGLTMNNLMIMTRDGYLALSIDIQDS